MYYVKQAKTTIYKVKLIEDNETCTCCLNDDTFCSMQVVSAESIGDRSNRQAYSSQRVMLKRKSVIEMNIVKSMFLVQ